MPYPVIVTVLTAMSPRPLQLAVTIGIFAAQLINYRTATIAVYGWRISLALGGVPALMLFFGAMFLPDTPNSLIARGMPEESRAVLQRVRGTKDVDIEYEDIAAVRVAPPWLPSQYFERTCSLYC